MIHADLFPDNVFFRDRELTGLIDFYFACTDFLAYDLAICLNAWCFEPDGSFNVTKARLLVGNYLRARPLRAGRAGALPLLARGSALRFLLTRLYDWLNQPTGALVRPKDPLEYLQKLRFHRGIAGPGRLWHRCLSAGRNLHRWRVQRQSRPRRLGRDAALSARSRRSCPAARRATTNNRMELMAAIAALEALKRPCRVALYTDSQYLRDGITKWLPSWKARGWRTADKKPVKNVDLWQRLEAAAAQHEIEWHWVRGHAGHPENERADALARAAIAELRSRT